MPLVFYIILFLILLLIMVVYLIKIERHLKGMARIQRAESKHTLMRLESEKLEQVLFRKFIQEDFARSEMSLEEQHEAFRKWEISNGKSAKRNMN